MGTVEEQQKGHRYLQRSTSIILNIGHNTTYSLRLLRELALMYVCVCVCASVPFERNSTFPSLDNKVVHGDGIWLGSLPGWYHYCVSCSPTSLIFNACVYFLVSFRCFAPDQSPPLAHTAQHYSFERQVSFLRSFHIQFGKAAQAVMGDGSDLIWQRRARVRMNCFAQPGTRGAKRLN